MGLGSNPNHKAVCYLDFKVLFNFVSFLRPQKRFSEEEPIVGKRALGRIRTTNCEELK
jgi:hypothetical protein